MKHPGESGFRGVRPTDRGSEAGTSTRWQAYGPAATGTTSTVHLGSYDTKEEAVKVVNDYLWRCQRRLLKAEQHLIAKLLDLGCEAAPSDLSEIAEAFAPKAKVKEKDPLSANARAVLELVTEEYARTGQPVTLPGFSAQCARLAVLGYLTEHASLSGRSVVRTYTPARPGQAQLTLAASS